MPKIEYLIISEFAKRAGVSRQTVYNKMSNDSQFTKKFVKDENGKKTISVKALELFESVKPVSKSKQVSINNQIELLQRQIDSLQADKAYLQEQTQELLKSLQFEQNKTAELQRLLSATTAEPRSESSDVELETETRSEQSSEDNQTIFHRFLRWWYGE